MLRKVSISWYKQRSGSFALKGITISEDDRCYDSGSTFRDEDAEWLTATLNATPDVEIARTRGDERSREGYPQWAENKGEISLVDDVAPIVLERANATLLRHFLTQIIEVVGTGTTGDGTDDPDAPLHKLVHDADTLLRSTNCGTRYSVEEALAILTKREKKPRAARTGQ